MRVAIRNGEVVCSLENKCHDFLFDCYGCFTGFNKLGELRMSTIAPTSDKEARERWDFNTLSLICATADKYGVEVTDEARQRLEELDSAVKAWDEYQAQRALKYAAVERWEQIQKRGCAKCSYVRRTGDDEYACGMTGDDLETKNIGLAGTNEIIGCTALYVFAPYPTDSCPFKCEAEAEDKEDYGRWQTERAIPF